jgi:Bacterial Ig-like domain (group 3)
LCYSLNSAMQPVRTSGCPSGTVSLTDSGAALDGGSFALNATGYFEDQPIQLPVGSHKIAAAYAGDNSFTASTSATNTISITQAATTTAANSSATIIAPGGTVMLTAIVSSNSNSKQGPTGTVQFLNGGVSLGAAATCAAAGATSNTGASCTATLQTTLSALPPGIIDVRPPSSPLVFLAWLAAALAMMAFLLSLTLAAKRKQYAYAGVAFFLIASAVLAGCGGGSASGAGGGSTRSITAKYSGDANYGGSTSSAITVTIQ